MLTLKELTSSLNAKLDEAEKVSAELGSDELTQEAKDEKTASLKALVEETEALDVQVKEASAKEDECDALRNKIMNAARPQPSKTIQQFDKKLAGIKTHENVMDDPKRGFSSLTDVMRSAYNAALGTHIDPRLGYLSAAVGMNQGSGPAGGFAVPPSFGDSIWSEMQQDSANLWNMTDNFTVEGESLTFPAVDETSRADGSRWGGIQAFWIKEAGVKPPSNPTLREVEVRPEELIVFSAMTDKLINNSPFALEQWLNRAAADEIGFRLSDAVVNGTGSGMPTGFLNSTATIDVAKESGQAADTVVVANIEKMFARFPQWKIGNAVWLANQTIMPQLNTMTLGDTPIYLPSNNVAGSPFATIKGIPVIYVEYMATLGDRGDIALVDLSAYFSGTQAGGVMADQSIHFYFDTNQKAFRWVVAADGKPWTNTPLIPKNGDTLSPFVTLAERA